MDILPKKISVAKLQKLQDTFDVSVTRADSNIAKARLILFALKDRKSWHYIAEDYDKAEQAKKDIELFWRIINE